MNDKEIGEIRRHLRRDRSNITAIYGCYVNDNKEVISEFRQSTGIMPENESDKYFALLRRSLSGAIGKNLIDITFKTSQVAGSPEHKMLMDLRETKLADDALRREFCQKIIDTVTIEGNYLILLCCDSYDVPFKSKDGDSQADNSDETYTFILCAICPVKQTKANLHYVPEEKLIHDGAMNQMVSAPALGFLFPAFDDRAANIYNALFYSKNAAELHQEEIAAVFRTEPPMSAEEQKNVFGTALGDTLQKECSYDVVQSVHEQLRERIAEHKESQDPEVLTLSIREVGDVLTISGVSEEKAEAFQQERLRQYCEDVTLNPKNIIDSGKFQITTPEVKIAVAPEYSHMIEARVIDGRRYILIPADEGVEINGIGVNIPNPQRAEETEHEKL